MDNSKFLKVVIICLLLVNIGTLSFMWTQRGHMPPPQPAGGGRGSVEEFLTRELKLNEQQQQQYEVLRKEHHEGVVHYDELGKELKDRYFAMLHDSHTDSALVKQLADSIADTRKNIELITFYHFKKVRAICTTDEQKKKFDEVIGEALKSMDHGPRKGPGGPQGPPDGPPPPPDRR
ncbi:MAG: hypothetical protein WCG87_09115 [Bacteroidota bacterium]